MTKLKLSTVARRIGTYDISIQPDQDCCSLFVPKHPETKANLRRSRNPKTRLHVEKSMNMAVGIF